MAQLPSSLADVIRTVPELPDAACAGRDPWFDLDVSGESTDDRRYRHAHATTICARCPASRTCREIADRLDPPAAGVWAGEIREPRGKRNTTTQEGTT